MIIDGDTHFLPPDAYDCLGEERERLRPRFVLDAFGADRFLFATDHPHDVPGQRMK